MSLLDNFLNEFTNALTLSALPNYHKSMILDDLKEIDLTDDEQYNEIVKCVEGLKELNLFNNLFCIDKSYFDEILQDLKDFREKLLAKKSKQIDNSKTPAQIEKKIEDKSVIEEPVIKRPSETIDTNVGLQIHKLVQEYIDTMVKPHASSLDSNVLNDAYAGLYEFACWVYQK